MATGMVADLGASDIISAQSPPSSQAITIADTTAVAEPASSAPATGHQMPRKRLHWRYRGNARATVAGPASQESKLAPSR